MKDKRLSNPYHAWNETAAKKSQSIFKQNLSDLKKYHTESSFVVLSNIDESGTDDEPFGGKCGFESS